MAHERARGSIRFEYDAAIAELFRHTTGSDEVDMWPKFDVLARRPVLVVRGEHSDLLSAEGIEEFKRRSPKVSAVTIPGYGHSPDLVELETLAAIEPFLPWLSG